MRQKTDYAKRLQERLEKTGKTKFWLAGKIGMNSQSLYYKFEHNTVREDEFHVMDKVLRKEETLPEVRNGKNEDNGQS